MLVESREARDSAASFATSRYRRVRRTPHRDARGVSGIIRNSDSELDQATTSISTGGSRTTRFRPRMSVARARHTDVVVAVGSRKTSDPSKSAKAAFPEVTSGSARHRTRASNGTGISRVTTTSSGRQRDTPGWFGVGTVTSISAASRVRRATPWYGVGARPGQAGVPSRVRLCSHDRA